MRTSLKINITALAVAGGLALAAPAQAATFNFSYTLRSGDTLSGLLEGDLQSDNDTVFVSALSELRFAGNPAPEATTVQSFASFLGLSSTPATVSLSGNVMNLLACPSSNCFENGFFFDTTFLPRAFNAFLPSIFGNSPLVNLNDFLPLGFLPSDLSAVLSGPGYYAGGSGYGDDVLEVFNAANWFLVEKIEVPADNVSSDNTNPDQPGSGDSPAEPIPEPEVSNSDQPSTGTDQPGTEAVPEPLSILGTLGAMGAGLTLRQKRKKST